MLIKQLAINSWKQVVDDYVDGAKALEPWALVYQRKMTNPCQKGSATPRLSGLQHHLACWLGAINGASSVKTQNKLIGRNISSVQPIIAFDKSNQ